MRTPIGVRALVAAGIVHMAGCGGQTGDVGGSGGSACVEDPSQAGDTAEVAVAAGDVLPWLEGSFESTLEWAPSDTLAFSPSASQSPLHIGIDCPEPNTGVIHVSSGDDNHCSDRLTLDCDVQLESDDGGLAEHTLLTLKALSTDFVSFSRAFDPATLSGSFEMEPAVQGGERLKEVSIFALLSPFGSSGYLSGVLEPAPEAVMPSEVAVPGRTPLEREVGVGEFAASRSETCSGFAVDAGVRVSEMSNAELVALMVPAEPVTLRWEDGKRTQLALDMRVSGSGCIMIEPDYDEKRAFYSTRGAARSVDSGLDAEFEGKLTVGIAPAGELVWSTIDSTFAVSREQVASLLRTTLEDVQALTAGYDELRVRVLSELRDRSGSGFVHLLGCSLRPSREVPPNPTPPPSECADTSFFVLLESDW